MALCEKILIAGFSGAGKTSLLRELQATAPFDWTNFEDLDLLILKTHGKGHRELAALIDEIGWETFRLLERQTLESWLKEEGKGILALGGGTISPLIWELYSKNPKIIFCYLWAPFETCWKRLSLPGEERPLVRRGKAELEKIYQERELIFNQIPWRICNDGSETMKLLARQFWQSVS